MVFNGGCAIIGNRKWSSGLKVKLTGLPVEADLIHLVCTTIRSPDSMRPGDIHVYVVVLLCLSLIMLIGILTIPFQFQL